MILVKILEGPFAGRIRPMPRNKNPVSACAFFIKMNWRWETDYSKATSEEFISWFRIELIAKIAFAFKRRIPVYFLGKKYLPPERDGDRYENDIQELEDIIAKSGRLIVIGQDDDNRLVIEAVGFEKDQKGG